MKNKTKIVSIIAGCFAMIIGFSSCIKNRLPLETDFSHLQDHVGIIKGGLTNFGAANFSFFGADSVTLTLIVNLESANLPSSPLKVTIGVDAAKLDSYNSANGTSYTIAPSNSYIIGSTTLTIPAGQQFAETTVTFIAADLDPTISYMLPISIMDASGKQLTGNLNTIYYHIIGNPIAGIYTWNFTRWSDPDTTTHSPDGNSFTGGEAIFVPDDKTTVEVPSGYYIGPRYVISFDNIGGVLSNFNVILNPDDVATMANAGVIVTKGPIIMIADPIAKHYKFFYTTKTRAVIDEYYQ